MEPVAQSRRHISRWIRGLGLVVAVALSGCDTLGGKRLANLGWAAHSAGADLPYVEVEAETGDTNGVIVGPSRTLSTLAAEASGLKAVQLSKPGDYVAFTLTRPANAVDIRFSLPDSADGKGLDATLSLYVNGAKLKDLALTSRYSWYYGAYPFSNRPADGVHPFHFYDDVRTLLGQRLMPGDTVRLQVDPGDDAPSYTIDLVDFEDVAAPKTPPRGALSVTAFGADPTGKTEATAAIQKAIDIAGATGKVVWIPPGEFRVDGHLDVDHVTIRGAGPWYSVLAGDGVGLYGRDATGPGGPSRQVDLADFAIFGEVAGRNDAAVLSGIGGGLDHSSVTNVWIEHTKVAIWVDGPISDLVVRRCRFRNLTADGVNFHRGVRHSTVTQSMIRNTGDDGLAMWSEGLADTDDVFSRNTVQLPMLANGIAIYGGQDNGIIANRVSDTLWQGGGLQVSNRFNAVPLSGTTSIEGNRLDRTGAREVNWNVDIGAIWLFAQDAPLNGRIRIVNNTLADSAYSAVHILGSKPEMTVSGVEIDRLTLDGLGTSALRIQANGAAHVRDLVMAGAETAVIDNCGHAFDLVPMGGAFLVSRCIAP